MPTSEADCPFCRIIAGGDPVARVVGETSDVLAFFPLNPATVGHTLLIPKVHRRDLWDLRADEAVALWKYVKPLSEAVRRAFRPEGINLIHSTGQVASQTVFHFHLHVVPRWSGDRMPNLWPPEKESAPSALDLAAMSLRQAWVDCLGQDQSD